MASLRRPDNMIDLSHGSSNTYLVEARHGLILPCIHCRKFRPILLDGNEYWNFFMRGVPIERAFPSLTLEQREILISGTHPECWAELFAGVEE